MLPQLCFFPLDLLFSELNVSQEVLDPIRQGPILLIQGLDKIILGKGENVVIFSSVADG